MCEAAQQRGMDVKEKLIKRRQKMNLRMQYPTEFRGVDSNIKMP